MFRPTLLALLVVPATALAQEAPDSPDVFDAPGAPGQCVNCAGPVLGPERPPVVAPMVVAPMAAPVAVAVVARPADMTRRFGVSARAVSLTLVREGQASGEGAEYGGGGIAASYRISRRWEVQVALDALDAKEGPDLHSTSISARFHLTPHRRWDWYLLAGVGVLHEAPPEGEDRTDDAGRGRFHAGVGLARRWRSWSLAAELHSVAVGPKETDDTMATPLSTTPPTVMNTNEKLSGGELTLAATFFF